MSNSAIAAKAKAVYGSFLKKSDYDNLIQRNSVSSVVSYLKTTPRYSAAFSEIDENAIHRGKAEEILGEFVFRDYLRLRKFGTAKKGSILDFYIRKSETEQIIKLIIAVATKNQQSFFLSLPVYLMDYLSFDPASASHCADFGELSKFFGKTKLYKPLAEILNAEKPDINKSIIAANGCYLAWAFSTINRDFKGKQRDTLKQFLLRKIDADNVLLCYRLKKYFDESEERIKELMLPYHYRVKPDDIDTALKAQKPTEAIIQLMEKKCLSKGIAVDEEFPEISAAKADFNCFRHRLSLTGDENEAVFALLILADNERTNLQKTIEGIRYGESPAEIEKLIII